MLIMNIIFYFVSFPFTHNLSNYAEKELKYYLIVFSTHKMLAKKSILAVYQYTCDVVYTKVHLKGIELLKI